MLTNDPLKLVGNAVFCHFYLVVAIATTSCCSGVERIPEHIPVVIFCELSCRFTDVRENFGISTTRTTLNHRATSEKLSFF